MLRGGTASPPPSPSPSPSAFSTSGGRTDTDPTSEDEYIYIKREPESVKLPPLRLGLPEDLRVPQEPLPAAPRWRTESYAASAFLQRPGTTSSSSASPSASPEAHFSRLGRRDFEPLRTSISDVRTRIPSSSEELPPLSSPPPTWMVQDSSARPRGRSAQPQHSRPAPTAPQAEPMELSPTPRKYRFVASKPQLAAAEQREDAVEHHRAPDVPAPANGVKRSHAQTTRPSSVESPSQSSNEDDDDGPRKRAPRQQPFDIGLFPASEAAAGRAVRGPRGAIVPQYHYDTDRALKCAFASCGTVLSGKKSETASHMRSHFLQSSGETLLCPWPIETEDGQRVRCSMAFKDSANFGRHVSSKHIKAEEYQCNRCGRPFARRDAALRHMKTLCRTDAPQSSRRKGGEKKKAKAKVDRDGEHSDLSYDVEEGELT